MFIKNSFYFLAAFIFCFSQGFSHVSKETLNTVKPYLLPADHPAKLILDRIFSSTRATLNLKKLKDAGFINPKVRRWTHLVVTKHPDLPGYIFKIYLDAQRHFKNMREHDHWLKRIKGARAIQKILDENNWNHCFKVPKKWIYKLPGNPRPSSDYVKKHFILIEDDMDLRSDDENAEAWKSSLVDSEKLTSLFYILDTVGLRDCSKIHNIPFSKDGRIAFIDTETTEEWPITYSRLNDSLSDQLKDFWKTLYESHE